MEYKLLNKNEINLMKEVIEDDDMIFNELELEKFINDKNTLGFIAKE